MAAQGSSGNPIDLGDDKEGPWEVSTYYRFYKAGDAIKYCDPFDPDCLPSQPLAVSTKSKCLFLATPDGFCVTHIEDVLNGRKMESDKKLLQLNLSIGRVSMLVISVDESKLAAVLESHIQFFSVTALTLQEIPRSLVSQHEAEEAKVSLYSVSLYDCGRIKDMKWAKEDVNAYLILSDNGTLYYGSGQASPTLVMEDVDAFDFGKGFVVVAKNNSLRILSLAYDEIRSFLLPFCSAAGDSDLTKKVDSVRYVRQDSIAIGSFELNDGKEEYIVRIVTSCGRPIMHDVNPEVVSFGFFYDFNRTGPASGPHMFLKHLFLKHLNKEKWTYEIALVANPKMSQTVGLLKWELPRDGKKFYAVDIGDDARTFHLDPYQDDGEDTVMIGMCIDETHRNMSVYMDGKDYPETVTTHFFVFCATKEGKLSAHELHIFAPHFVKNLYKNGKNFKFFEYTHLFMDDLRQLCGVENKKRD